MNKFFFMFPGQGSQRVGMASELINESTVAKSVFEEANDTLKFDLKDICLSGPSEKLNLTKYTQPAILTASIAAWSVIKDRVDFEDCVFAGHSLGEYSALVASRKLTFADAVQAVHQRGQFMQEAVKEGVGSMAAIIGCEPELIQQVCHTISLEDQQIVEVANFNSPVQTVISGLKESVQKATDRLKEKHKAKCIPLTVSAPFHCSLMREARDKMATVLEEIPLHANKNKIVANYDATLYTANYNKQLLLNQIDHSVNWTTSLYNIYGLGFKNFVEVGPGRVLCGLTKKSGLSEVTATHAFDVQNLQSIV